MVKLPGYYTATEAKALLGLNQWEFNYISHILPRVNVGFSGGTSTKSGKANYVYFKVPVDNFPHEQILAAKAQWKAQQAINRKLSQQTRHLHLNRKSGRVKRPNNPVKLEKPE